MKNPFKILIIILSLCAENFTLAQVKMWEEQQVIPTWEIGPPEKHPAFPETIANHFSDRKVYPYPYKDILTKKETDKIYQTCWLENEFIRVLITPEIGGKLYGAKDKTNDYNFFYWQPTVKPALIGLTGAWVSGGIEWNFPTGHRNTTFSPVSYRLMDNEDGSKTVWTGETEWVFGMRWIVGITIFPNKSVIEAKIRLLNPTPLQHSYYSWTTTATHANENYQLIYPTDIMTDHGYHHYYHWPEHEGVDISWWKNIPNASSYFAHEPGGFFGGYDHGKQAGTVICGNEHIMIGKKFWTWGTSPSGRIWDWILSDGGGPYAEPQAGSYSDNQPDFHWMTPGDIKSFSLFFFPVKEIGLFKQANKHGALNLEFKENRIKIGVYSTSLLEQALIRLTENGNIIFEHKGEIDPSRPFLHELSVKAACDDHSAYSLELLDKSGKSLISYTPQENRSAELPVRKESNSTPEDVKSTDELWIIGDKAYKFRYPGKAKHFFNKIIKRDSLNTRARISLAEMDIKSAKYESALNHLHLASERADDYGKIFFLNGVAQESLEDFTSAYKSYYRAVHFHTHLSAAYERIARIDMHNGNYSLAVDHAQKAIANNTLNPQLWALKASALRKCGRFEDALKTAGHAQSLDPLNSFAVYEYILALERLEKNSEQNRILLKQLLINDYQYYIHLASEYIHCGLYLEANDVLNMALDNKIAPKALLYYYLGYCYDVLNEKENARNAFNKGLSEQNDYVFPFRQLALKVFKRALVYNQNDHRAYYYLGMVNAGMNNGAESIIQWKKSIEIDPNNAKAYRNLGLLYAGYPEIEVNLERSKSFYEEAFRLAPDNSLILNELDKVNTRLSMPSKDRLALLKKNKKIVESRDRLLIAMLDLMMENGDYEEALPYYFNHEFYNWEGGYGVHNSYLKACLSMAEKANNSESALEWYKKADAYPKNLKVGPMIPDLRGFIYVPMAKILKKLGKKSAADSLLTITLKEKTSPPSMATYYQALAYKELGHIERAQAIMDSLKVFGESLIVNSTSAEKIFQKALGYFYLSKVYESRGDEDKAENMLAKAISIDPSVERNSIIIAQNAYASMHEY